MREVYSGAAAAPRPSGSAVIHRNERRLPKYKAAAGNHKQKKMDVASILLLIYTIANK
jgi:hypothetical protein